jgi:hypothetical protein
VVNGPGKAYLRSARVRYLLPVFCIFALAPLTLAQLEALLY